MQEGRRVNIEQIFRANYRKLCLYATHIVQDIDVAEDIVMDQFLKLAEKTDAGEAILSPKSYLYQMVRNASLDHLNKNIPIDTTDELTDLPDEEDISEERLERESKLWAQVDALPPACRKILLMSKCKDMKYREIADALGISVKTVETQIGKAYAILRGKAKEIYLFFF